MPVVTVEMWEGRTVEQKKKLVEGTSGCYAIFIDIVSTVWFNLTSKMR